MQRYNQLSNLYGDLGSDPSDMIKSFEDLLLKTEKVKFALNARDYQGFAIQMSDIIAVWRKTLPPKG